jgi:PAS domain S-box-containing protein
VAVYESKDGETFTIADFNMAAEKIEGVEKSDIIGRRVEEVFPGIASIGLLDAFKKVWRTGEPERVPCAMYEDAFRRGWRDNYVYRLQSGEVVAVYDDVTDKRNTAEKVSDSISSIRENEARFHGLFNNSPQGVVFTSAPPEYRITRANKSFCDFLGCPPEEITSKTVADITHPDDLPDTLRYIDAIRNPNGRVQQITKRYVRKDGKTVWGRVAASCIRHADGRIESFAEVDDITEIKEAEDTMRRYAELVDSTGQMAKVGGWEFDIATGKQVWTNEVYRIHEVDKDFVPTVELGVAFYAPSSRPEIELAVKEAMEKGKPFDMELEIITAKGNRKWVHTIGRADLAKQKVFGTFQDVTERIRIDAERKRVMAEIKESQRALERANAILSVECDAAKSIAVDKDGGLNAVMCRAGRKLGVKWMCIVVIGDGGVMGRWTDESGSSVNSIDEFSKLDAADILAVRKWVASKERYVGTRAGMPECLLKLSKPVGDEWLAIPVAGRSQNEPIGVALISTKGGNKWSKDEYAAIEGLATLLCILARGEKNRQDLSRRIEQTIGEISEIIGPTNGGGRGNA